MVSGIQNQTKSVVYFCALFEIHVEFSKITKSRSRAKVVVVGDPKKIQCSTIVNTFRSSALMSTNYRVILCEIEP